MSDEPWNQTKRRREDGQVRREEYEDNERIQRNETSHSTFQKADAQTLQSRRMVISSSTRKSRNEEFVRHMQSLNKSYYNWFKSHSNESKSLKESASDYLNHLSTLQERYMRTYGEVLTFGSGDCGQLAHGDAEESDLLVKYPRIVYSLRDKKVCGIACGGLHNAVYTETGQVYTWGCNDDGSLGRLGEEFAPILVDGLQDVIVTSVACGDGQTLALTTTGVSLFYFEL